MAKKAFLIPFAAVLSGVWNSASGAAPFQAEGSQASENPFAAAPETSRPMREKATETATADFPVGEDLFRFVIRRTSDGQIFADHESHYSHSSHRSHHSHYSSR